MDWNLMRGRWDHYLRTYIYTSFVGLRNTLWLFNHKVVQPQDVSSTRRIYTSRVDSKKHPWHSSGK